MLAPILRREFRHGERTIIHLLRLTNHGHAIGLVLGWREVGGRGWKSVRRRRFPDLAAIQHLLSSRQPAGPLTDVVRIQEARDEQKMQDKLRREKAAAEARGEDPGEVRRPDQNQTKQKAEPKEPLTDELARFDDFNIEYPQESHLKP